MAPITCYVCGRDFGPKSIPIHLPNCKRRFEREQKKLPKSQRRDMPRTPKGLDRILDGDYRSDDLRRYNEEALKKYRNNNESDDDSDDYGDRKRRGSRRSSSSPRRGGRRRSRSESSGSDRSRRRSKSRGRSPTPPRRYLGPKRSGSNKRRSGSKNSRSNSRHRDKSPSREDLIEIIRKKPAFGKQEVREELMEMLDDLQIDRRRK